MCKLYTNYRQIENVWHLGGANISTITLYDRCKTTGAIIGDLRNVESSDNSWISSVDSLVDSKVERDINSFIKLVSQEKVVVDQGMQS